MGKKSKTKPCFTKRRKKSEQRTIRQRTPTWSPSGIDEKTEFSGPNVKGETERVTENTAKTLGKNEKGVGLVSAKQLIHKF